ncbi:Uncharacterised protein [Chlamydia abortus]|nr:Uncharacterised protein [Chlamydia abortus]
MPNCINRNLPNRSFNTFPKDKDLLMCRSLEPICFFSTSLWTTIPFTQFHLAVQSSFYVLLTGIPYTQFLPEGCLPLLLPF